MLYFTLCRVVLPAVYVDSCKKKNRTNLMPDVDGANANSAPSQRRLLQSRDVCFQSCDRKKKRAVLCRLVFL